MRLQESVLRMTAQIWLWRGRMARCRLAAMIGISGHSCASEKEAMLVAAMKPGSSRWPPEAQFSRMMPGTSRLTSARKSMVAIMFRRRPSPGDSAPSPPMPMVSL